MEYYESPGDLLMTGGQVGNSINFMTCNQTLYITVENSDGDHQYSPSDGHSLEAMAKLRDWLNVQIEEMKD